MKGLVSNYNYILDENNNWIAQNYSTHIGQINKKYTAFPKQIVLYAQSLANDNISFNGSSYNRILSLNPLPSNYDNNSNFVPNLDYKESDAITNTSEQKIIDEEFLLLDRFYNKLKIAGTQKVVADATCKGDGTATTYLSKINFKLYQRGPNESLIAEVTYNLSNTLAQTADSYADSVAFYKHINIDPPIELNASNLPSLVIQVYGYVNVSGASNKVKLNFARGSADTYMILNILEE